MTSDKGKAFWLGIFVIIAICTVAWLFLFLKPSVGDSKTTLKIYFTNIEGVTIGTRVNFGGKPVGTVVAIHELVDARSTKPNSLGAYYFFEVIAKVDSSVRIYSYDEVVLTSQGLLGEKSIEIYPRAAPTGGKPAVLVTDEILYARSGDQVQAAIDRLNLVLAKVSDFVDTNAPLFEKTLTSINTAADHLAVIVDHSIKIDFPGRAANASDAVTKAMTKACCVFDDIIEHDLVKQVACAASEIGSAATGVQDVTDRLICGQGTLPRLINSDLVYQQIRDTLCELEGVLTNIKNYGLLFQYDKKWQRQRVARMRAMEECENAQNCNMENCN